MTEPVAPGDRVRAGRVVGTVRRVLEGVAELQDDGKLLGRPTTWRIKVEALTKVPREGLLPRGLEEHGHDARQRDRNGEGIECVHGRHISAVPRIGSI
jgi:hypothetical protein